MIWIARRWRFPKVIAFFFITEFICTIPALVLFALADPNEYRTKLWEDGFLNGFNSSPKTALYQMANYEPVHIPLVWSQFLTGFNMIISVFSMFFLLVKGIMFIMHIWLPIISFIVHGGIASLWAYSVYGQTSSDMQDPKRPQPGAPWYITKSCSVAYYKKNIGYCNQAKGCLAIAVVMLTIFTANTIFAAICIVPSAKEREERERQRQEEADDDDEDLESEFDPDIGIAVRDVKSSDESIAIDQMQMAQVRAHAHAQALASRHAALSAAHVRDPAVGATSAATTTPRTTAFHRLGGAGAGGDLPLRR